MTPRGPECEIPPRNTEEVPTLRLCPHLAVSHSLMTDSSVVTETSKASRRNRAYRMLLLAHLLPSERLTRRTFPRFRGSEGREEKFAGHFLGTAFTADGGKLSVSCIKGFDPNAVQRATGH